MFETAKEPENCVIGVKKLDYSNQMKIFLTENKEVVN